MFFNIDYIKEKSDDIIQKITSGNTYETERLSKVAKEVLKDEDLNEEQLYRITETVNQVLFMKKHASGDTFVEFDVLDAATLSAELSADKTPDAASELVGQDKTASSDYDEDFWYLKDELKKEASLNNAIDKNYTLTKTASLTKATFKKVDPNLVEKHAPSRFEKRSSIVKKEGAYMAALNDIEYDMKNLLAKHAGANTIHMLNKFADWSKDHIAEKEYLYEQTFDLMVKNAKVDVPNIWEDMGLMFDEEDSDIASFKKLANDYYKAYNIFKELKAMKKGD